MKLNIMILILLVLSLMSLCSSGKKGWLQVKIKIRLQYEEGWNKYKIPNAYMKQYPRDARGGAFNDIGIYFSIRFPEDDLLVQNVFETYLVKDEDFQIKGEDPIYTLPFYDIRSVLNTPKTKLYQKEYVEMNLYEKDDEVPARFVIYFPFGEGKFLKDQMTYMLQHVPGIRRSQLLNAASFIENERQKRRQANNLASMYMDGKFREGYLDNKYYEYDNQYRDSIDKYKDIPKTIFHRDIKEDIKLEIKNIKQVLLSQYQSRLDSLNDVITNRLKQIDQLEKSSEKKKAVKTMLEEYMNSPILQNYEFSVFEKYQPKTVVDILKDCNAERNFTGMIDELSLIPFADFPKA